jgi:hypothetical protein
MVSVTNTAATPITNASVSYRVNNGTIYSTHIGTVAANSTIPVSLTPTTIFQLQGPIILKSGRRSADDDFHANDTYVQTFCTTL